MKEIIEIDSILGNIKTFKNDLITDQIIKFGNHTRPEFAFATSIISDNFNIFDLGAHIGTFTLTVIKKLKNFKSSTPQIPSHNHHNPLWGIKDWELDLRRLGRSTAPLLFYCLKIFYRLVYF